MENLPSKEMNLKELIKGSNGELIKLQDFNQTIEILNTLAKKYKDFKVTKENLKEAKEIRLELREHRYGIQNVTKHNKDLLNQAKKIQETNDKSLIDLIEPTENIIDEGIKAIENAVKLEKERKEKEEQERITNISKKLADYRSQMEVIYQIGKTNEQLKEFDIIFGSLNSDIELEVFQEFAFEGVELVDEFQEKRNVIVNRIEEEKKLELQKIEQDKIQKEQQEKNAKLLEQQLQNEAKAKELNLKANKLILKEKGFELVDQTFVKNDISIEVSLIETIEENDLLSLVAVEEKISKLRQLGCSDEFIDGKMNIIMTSSDEDFKTLEESILKEIEEKDKQAKKEAADKLQADKKHQEELKRIKLMQKEIAKVCTTPFNDFVIELGNVVTNSKLYDLGNKHEVVNNSLETFQSELNSQLSILRNKLFIK